MNLVRSTLALAALAISIATPARAQNVSSYTEWFSKTTDALVARTKAPALSVAVMENGRQIYSDAGGSVETPPRRGPGPSTMYRIGSVSKLYTASIAARLASRGIINLDANVRQYVPEYSEKNAPITLRQLAGHLSGIRHYGAREFISTTAFDSLAPTIAIFAQDSLLFAPGTKYSYSSYGFNLLGLALERAAHKPFLRLLHDEVIEPLHLKLTAPDMPGAKLPERATTFDVNAEGVATPTTPDNLSDRWPSGGLLASVTDLARFGTAFVRPGFLPDSMITMMTTHQHLASGASSLVGLGWRIGVDSAGRTIWHHGGTSNGGRALLVVWPEEKLVVAIASDALVPFDLPNAYAFANIAREGRKYR
ncbi:MAG: serine hydrolase domain-containing protein [Gemmatimonadota bacterium]